MIADNPSGTPQWVLMPPLKGIGDARIRAICPIGEGGLILGGSMRAKGVLDFGNGVMLNGMYPSKNLFVAKFSSR